MIKITESTGVKSTDKSKKTSKPSQTGGPNFADLLETDAPAGATTPQTSSYTPYSPILNEQPEDQQPATPKQLLDTLEELAADVLTGTPTHKAQQLQTLLDNLPDKQGKTPEQQQVLDELATRAAITLAQLNKK